VRLTRRSATGRVHEFCRVEFDIGQSRSYQLLQAGEVVAEIEAYSTTVESEAQSPVGNSLPPVPNERIARELARDDKPAEAWAEVVELPRDPTAKDVRAVVEERRELKDPATDKQMAYLRSLVERTGARLPDGPVSKARASDLIDHLNEYDCECRKCGRTWR
jgi:hypothetical protein